MEAVAVADRLPGVDTDLLIDSPLRVSCPAGCEEGCAGPVGTPPEGIAVRATPDPQIRQVLRGYIAPRRVCGFLLALRSVCAAPRRDRSAAVTEPDRRTRRADPLPHTYRVSKYDPADRDADGAYTGTESSVSDHGPVEAAYLAAFTAFAEDAGVDHVLLREPEVAGFVNFGLEPNVAGHGLRGLFSNDLTGYHDGASVPLETARELLRGMLRDHGAWCRLEVDGRFTAHVGLDQYLYLASSTPPDRGVALIEESGLFPERIDESPYLWQSDDPPARAADRAFWDEVAALVTQRGPLLLEEASAQNASRWHRLNPVRIGHVRAGLAPRSCLLLWRDLSTDLHAVRKELRKALRDGSARLVSEDHLEVLTDQHVVSRRSVKAALSGVRAAWVMPDTDDGDRPLVTAVLPDADGVLRARWTPSFVAAP